ncbi:cysteine-rich secretory protein-2 [Culex quinquefasciatus]|uniref:Cysteine-rich secretory protein-2 n=1 Tax=Culex quinquefasciatus TaxID=7176 RepID=B0VZU2_CULQU|nr:Golgi-associated plant pathogenesis-related protein 1 [Culex quinquefasciatus]EDS35184.1 cysteine-rich secretory protein-2 [Culex quinquefasciatus]|eukprot:XP_001841976.1 cysteine-rich secretory protein-2 [Culex quinquefasciatus]
MSAQFQQQVLDEHNRLRAIHAAPPLKLNQAMCAYAQEWAEDIARRKTLQHRTDKKYGENIYAIFGRKEVSGGDAVASWYAEIKDYTFGEKDPGGNFGRVGHFTQVVWKNCKELGVGMATNGDSVFVVCNYDPPGNYKNQYADNVRAAK